MIVAHRAPPMPFLPPERYGTPGPRPAASCWAGDIAEGMRATAPLRAVGTPLADVVRPIPYRALQSLLDGSAAARHALLLAVPPAARPRPTR